MAVFIGVVLYLVVLGWTLAFFVSVSRANKRLIP
jgi:hypothetical protein